MPGDAIHTLLLRCRPAVFLHVPCTYLACAGKASTLNLFYCHVCIAIVLCACLTRPAARASDRIYFRLGDVVGPQGQQVALNAEVSFVMVPDPRGNQDRAANVQILNAPFAADQLNMLPGLV